MKKLLLVGIVLLLSGGNLVLGGCWHKGNVLPFRVLSDPEAWSPGKEEPAYIVVTGDNWQNYYASLPEGADLINNIYVVASWGTNPNPGYRMSVLAVRQLGRKVQVALEQLEPEPGSAYAQVMVYPIVVVEVGKKSIDGGRVNFQFMNQRGSPLTSVEVDI